MIPVLMPVHEQTASFLPTPQGGFSLTAERGLQRQYINLKLTASTQTSSKYFFCVCCKILNCFLITIKTLDNTDNFTVLIKCGVLWGTPIDCSQAPYWNLTGRVNFICIPPSQALGTISAQKEPRSRMISF